MRTYGTAAGLALVSVTPIRSHSPRSLKACNIARASASSMSLPMSVSKITGRAPKQEGASKRQRMGRQLDLVGRTPLLYSGIACARLRSAEQKRDQALAIGYIPYSAANAIVTVLRHGGDQIFARHKRRVRRFNGLCDRRRQSAAGRDGRF